MADETFSTMESALDSCKAKENPLADNKVANFAYDDTAYENNNADGVESYDYNAHNNIPKGTPLVMDTNQTVLDKGYRSQASSITRMLMNHFFGRISYNLNKTVDTVNGLINNMKTFWGRPNGFATLDASGRIPFSQLPESAIEFKGLWDASTNTPTLADNTGTKGDFYIVSVAGTQNLGSGSIQFFVNDRVIYSGEVWTRLTSGDVQTVNGVHPQAGDVKNVIKLTQEQFDTLSSADRAGKFFIVTTSYAVGQSEINDNVTASDTTWSSNKIVSNLTGALTDYRKNYTTSMVALGFTKNATVNLSDFISSIFTNFGNGSYSLIIENSTSTNAYITDGNKTINILGGLIELQVTHDPKINAYSNVSMSYYDTYGKMYEINEHSAITAGIYDRYYIKEIINETDLNSTLTDYETTSHAGTTYALKSDLADYQKIEQKTLGAKSSTTFDVSGSDKVGYVRGYFYGGLMFEISFVSSLFGVNCNTTIEHIHSSFASNISATVDANTLTISNSSWDGVYIIFYSN